MRAPPFSDRGDDFGLAKRVPCRGPCRSQHSLRLSLLLMPVWDACDGISRPPPSARAALRAQRRSYTLNNYLRPPHTVAHHYHHPTPARCQKDLHTVSSLSTKCSTDLLFAAVHGPSVPCQVVLLEYPPPSLPTRLRFSIRVVAAERQRRK